MNWPFNAETWTPFERRFPSSWPCVFDHRRAFTYAQEMETTMPGNAYYHCAKHRKWRNAVLARAGYLCEECARYGRRVTATHAHHIKPRAEFPELQYDVENGKALCASCHSKIEPRTPHKAGKT
jgi:hypothetical protein